MALVLEIWIRSRVCSSAEKFLNHRLNRRPVSPASVQLVLNSLWHGFCIVSGTNSDRYTDGHRCIRWLTDEPMTPQRFFRCYCVGILAQQRLWTTLRPIHRRPPDTPMPRLRIFRCPSVDRVQTLSDLVKLKPTLTPMLKSLHQRSFRCLGFAGPHAPFLLYFSRAPHISVTPSSSL